MWIRLFFGTADPFDLVNFKSLTKSLLSLKLVSILINK